MRTTISLQLGVMALLGLLPVVAEDVRSDAAPPDFLYQLDVPSGEALTYHIPFVVDSTGTLIIDANWPGSRVLSFRLVGPSDASRPIRRSGPSPQTLTIDVDDENLFGEWNLTVNGLAVRGGGEGRLAIHLPTTFIPEPPEPKAAPVPPSPPHPRRASAAALPKEWASFARSAIGFTELLESEPLPDACHWQQSFRGWLDDRVVDLGQGGDGPDDGTRHALASIAGAISSVARVEDSSDPVLGAPPPDDPDRHQEWFQIRATKLLDIQRTLDKVAEVVRDGHAPALDNESWPHSLVACVTACERHFEERARLGAADAVNRETADAQWDRLLAASRAIEALAALPKRRGPDGGS